MGFSKPPRLRLERWALTPPFHPYRHSQVEPEFTGGIFSVALSIGTPYGVTLRVYPAAADLHPSNWLRGIAPSGVRTFLSHRLKRDGSDSPPFQNRD